MKTLLTIILLSLPLFAQDLTRIGGSIGNGPSNENPEYSAVRQTEDSPVKISASKIKPAQWGAIFTNQISKMYVVDNEGKWWQTQEFKFVQGTWKMNSTRFGPSKRYLKISQNVGGTFYLCYPYKEYDPFIIDLKASSYVDGQELYFYYGETSGTFSYTTVLGAKKTVRVMTLTEEPSYSEPTFEQFVQQMNGGAKFKIVQVGTIICPVCKGYGSVKNKPGRMPTNLICPQCKSKGKFEKEILHLASI